MGYLVGKRRNSMKFYAYKGKYDLGGESLGTSGKLLYERKTYDGAIRYAVKVLGTSCSVWRYTNFYNDSTFRRIY